MRQPPIQTAGGPPGALGRPPIKTAGGHGPGREPLRRRRASANGTPAAALLLRLLDLAFLDLAAPAAALRAATFDQFLEPVEVPAHAPPVDPGHRAHRLGDALRLVAHREPDEGALGRELLERDGATRRLPVLADPAD